MHKRRFLQLSALVFLAPMSLMPAYSAEDADKFPHRKTYPELKEKYIEIDALSKTIGDYLVVDTRSPFEYSVMHIQDAINIPVDDRKFVDDSKKAYAEAKKKILYYCNGTTCEKTYVAGMKATKGGFSEFMLYDGGIGEWAKVNPQQTVLLGKPLDPKLLISADKFKAHTLPPLEFMKRAQAQPTAMVIDIRSPSEREGINLFPGRDISTGFDLGKINKALVSAKEANLPVYAYDNAGHQIKSLQYLFEEQGVKDYYLMSGGMQEYYKLK